MAEVLIYAEIGYINPDPTSDSAGCYKKGDLVDVRDDGFPWEPLGPCVLVKVPGISAGTIQQYRSSSMNGTDVRKRRRYSVPSSYVDTIVAAGRVVTITNTVLTSKLVDAGA